MTSSPERVAEGQTVFASACAGCHGANAQGGRAPNLADATWVGVASKDDHAGIFRIIKEGVPGRMPAMGGRQLTDDQIHALTFYIQSL
jgi:cbb3-type cytochrome c oxidase subunit III